MILNSPYITGSLTVTGNANIQGQLTVTGSLSGIASTASFALTLDGTGSVGFATTGAFTATSGSASSRLTQIEQVYATTGSNSFRATQSITGSLTVTGQIIAQTINVQQVTSSIVFSSGSNIFGNQLANNQTFTGSVNITGSLAIAGNITGNAITLTGALSGTSATFSMPSGNGALTIANSSLSGKNWTFLPNTNGAESDLLLYYAGASAGTRLTIASTGAATLSSAGSVIPLKILNTTGTTLDMLVFETGWNAPSGNKNIIWKDATNTLGRISVSYDAPSATMRFGSLYNAGYQTSDLLTIAATGAATFSSSVTVGTIAALTPSVFGYSSSYPTLIIGPTGNLIYKTLTFGVDVSGNPSGAFSGTGNEYVWRNAASFITPNAINNGFTTLFGWNSSGQITFNQAATFSSSVSAPSITNGGQFKMDYGANAASRSWRLISDAFNFGDFSIQQSTTQSGSTYSDRLLISASGNVGIGTSSPNAKLYIIGNSTTQEIYYAEKSTASFTGNIFTSLCYTAAGTGWNHFIGYSDIGSTTNIKILGNGNIQNANNSYGAISDIKLKENITDASPKLDDLLKVKVRNYNLIGDESKQLGVIAQELEEVFPSMIEETEDYEQVEVTDKEGNITKERKSLGTVTKSVKYSVFVPMLIKAIQEQNEIITKQGQAITELKALIAAK